MDQYNGIIFTGGAMRLNDMTDEIKKHINFASNCFKHNKKILAICWGFKFVQLQQEVKLHLEKMELI